METLFLIVGAKNGTRTRDPDLGKVVLYQLSYFRSGQPLFFRLRCKGRHNFHSHQTFLQLFFSFGGNELYISVLNFKKNIRFYLEYVYFWLMFRFRVDFRVCLEIERRCYGVP